MSPDLSWTLSPGVLIGAALADGVYCGAGWQVALELSPRREPEAPVWRLCCFSARYSSSLIALISPIDSLADQLFFAHMIQHILLLDIARSSRSSASRR